jgi:hypothetical protein
MSSWTKSDGEREHVLDAVRRRKPVLAKVRLEQATGVGFANALVQSLREDVERVNGRRG